MKTLKKLVSIILCTAIIVPFALSSSSAAKAQPGGCYPIVFVHGLNGWGSGEGINGTIPYWGATTGDLVDYLEDKGYDCYSASVGPISSAWDRACELYAQLAGTVVDYGAAHSAQYGHLRYGRTYTEPLVPGWGELDAQGKINKIHLVGHSFGGTTVRMLVQLLAEGSAQERAAAPNDHSALFDGGKAGCIESVTTICTPHSSSTLFFMLKYTGLLEAYKLASTMYVGVAGRSPFNGRYVDFHMEQFGLSYTPGKMDGDLYLRAVARVLKNSEDTAQYDLQPIGAKRINDMIKLQPGIYYYSYAFSTTKTVTPLNLEVPSIRTNPVISLFSLAMGVSGKLKDPVTGMEFDESWRKNDALVNTVSALYPPGDPHVDYNPNAVPKPGIWNVMPVQKGDHGTAIGLLAEVQPTQQFYIDLVEMLSKLPA